MVLNAHTNCNYCELDKQLMNKTSLSLGLLLTIIWLNQMIGTATDAASTVGQIKTE